MTKNILIVDDNQDNLMVIQLLLESFPGTYAVAMADSGQKALSMIKNNPPDAMLLDIRMPDMDGFEVCRRIRRQQQIPYIPVIFLTAQALNAEDRIEGFNSGCDDYITKPVDRNELASRLNSVLRIKALTDALQDERNLLENKVIERTIKLQEEIEQRRKAEKLLEQSLKEKIVLLQEIHHRVKNNLNVISSILELQSMEITDTTSITALANCRDRVFSMASIHELLYETHNFAEVNFSTYTHNLMNQLSTAYKIDDSIKLEQDIAPDMQINLNQAIPLGLILNELISNALKYAFPNKQTKATGVISVQLQEEDTHNILCVKDNGIGLPGKVKPEQTTSLGLNLVNILTKQLNGSITFFNSKNSNENGMQTVIRFPKTLEEVNPV
ncbi:MAG: response regulator [Fibrobacteria bacterium]|nr:response regulator [Fibrobacteria bacterium]